MNRQERSWVKIYSFMRRKQRIRIEKGSLITKGRQDEKENPVKKEFVKQQTKICKNSNKRTRRKKKAVRTFPSNCVDFSYYRRHFEKRRSHYTSTINLNTVINRINTRYIINIISTIIILFSRYYFRIVLPTFNCDSIVSIIVNFTQKM